MDNVEHGKQKSKRKTTSEMSSLKHIRCWKALQAIRGRCKACVIQQILPVAQTVDRDRQPLISLQSVSHILPAPESTDGFQHLANTLHSTVIETYLDCAPSVFSPNATPSETEVQLILSVVRITRTLYHAILRSSSEVGLLMSVFSDIH